MQALTFDTQDVAMHGSDLFCRTPEALESALTTLREKGYTVEDLRQDAELLRKWNTTAEEMEREGAGCWYVYYDAHRGKCGSCGQLIDRTGIKSHGHRCEHEECGAVTYLELPQGARFRFRFLDSSVRSVFPQLEMQVIHWDVEDGWLYLDPIPQDANSLAVVSGPRAWQYLNRHADKWERTDYDGQPALKLRYIRMGAEDRSPNKIECMDITGSYDNHTIVRVWEGVEYPEYGPGFPVPEFIHVHELWHLAAAEQKTQ